MTDIEIPDHPIMPRASVKALTAALRQSSCYLEYGSGGTTVLACRLGVPTVVSIESDAAWIEAVRQKISETSPTKHLLHADIGPTKNWGYPATREHHKLFHKYPMMPWRMDISPDLVLVDGRFRVACFMATMLFARPGTRIFFDDYMNREHYHAAERFFSRDREIDRVALFTRPETINRDALWEALLEYAQDAR